MAKSWNLVFVLIWTAYLMCAGIHLFSKGFLLTRVAQTETNMCTQYEDYNCTGNVSGIQFNCSSYITNTIR